jgi:hypothetical protein
LCDPTTIEACGLGGGAGDPGGTTGERAGRAMPRETSIRTDYHNRGARWSFADCVAVLSF